MKRTSQVLGVEAVRDDAYFKQTNAKIIATRERVKKQLAELGFTFPDSQANFIFAKHASIPGEQIFKALKKRKIFVRHWNKDRIRDYLRITVGTDAEMDTLIDALKEITSR